MICNSVSENIEIKNIYEIDFGRTFFHYTNVGNIDSILKYGLLPKIGDNAIGVEKSKKNFFQLVIQRH